jgi:hypothetical protein
MNANIEICPVSIIEIQTIFAVQPGKLTTGIFPGLQTDLIWREIVSQKKAKPQEKQEDCWFFPAQPGKFGIRREVFLFETPKRVIKNHTSAIFPASPGKFNLWNELCPKRT